MQLFGSQAQFTGRNFFDGSGGVSAEDKLLQAELDAIEDEKDLREDQGAVSSKLAAQFLGEWNKGLSNLTGMYNVASGQVARSYGYLDEAGDFLDSASDSVGQLDDLVADIDNSLQEYRTAFNPLRDEAVAGAREGIQTERELTGTIKDLSQADYEGVSGTAKADVAAESENARRAEARNLQGMGINPNSGNYKDSMRKSYINEAINKVLAGNMARIGEKNRVAGVAVSGLNAIDPSSTYGIAKDITAGDTNLVGAKANMVNTGIKARSDIAGMAGNIASAAGNLANAQTGIANSYGSNVVAPTSEMYATNLGTAMATDPTKIQQ